MDEQWKQLLMIVLVFAAGIAVGVMLSENYAKDLAKETCGTCIKNYNILVEQYNREHPSSYQNFTDGFKLLALGITRGTNATNIWKPK